MKYTIDACPDCGGYLYPDLAHECQPRGVWPFPKFKPEPAELVKDPKPKLEYPDDIDDATF